MTRWLAARCALGALHLSYVTWHIGPSWLVALIALATAAGVLMATDVTTQRASLAAGALVLSVLHARALTVQSPWSAVQLGLAAAVAASSMATLLAVRMMGRAATSLLVTSLGGLALAWLSAPSPLWAVPFVIVAAARPLGAFGVVARTAGMNDGPPDPLLWWSPLVREARS